MNLDPQSLVVGLVVAAAMSYLAVRFLGLRGRRRGSACGSCGSCGEANSTPSDEPKAATNFVSVESLQPPKR